MSATDWLSGVGDLAIGAGTVFAAVVGVGTFRQQSRSSQRDQWWSRVQWALARALDGTDPDGSAAGLAMLTVLVTDRRADAADARMLESAWTPILAGSRTSYLLGGSPEAPSAAGDQARASDPRSIAAATPVERAAAALRVATDAKQGRASPQWVRDIAGPPSG